jgi:hypothetical protein
MTPQELLAVSPDLLRGIGERWRSKLNGAERVRVALRALDAVLDADRTGLVKETRALAEDPREWAGGKQLFHRLRHEVLRHERAGSAESAEALALALAEMTAQLSYNASTPQYPFDDSVIVWVPSCIRAIVANGTPDADVQGLASLIERDPS